MPSDGRWRRFEIVVPIDPSREEELVGGLKNAIERGDTLKDAMQSFINGGYNLAEVSGAARKVGDTLTQVKKRPVEYQLPDSVQAPSSGIKPLPATQVFKQKEKISRTMIIVLITVSVFILIGAVVLGVFWDKLF